MTSIEQWRMARYGIIVDGEFIEITDPDDPRQVVPPGARWVGGVHDYQLAQAVAKGLSARASEAGEAVAWRELSRRLYVELFHCDQQMRSTRDEEDEPHWTQSAVVRDVLHDAKAALDAAAAQQAVTLTDDARDVFIRKIAAQKPEKPDHWSSCGQCQHNAEEAQDLLDAVLEPKGDQRC